MAPREGRLSKGTEKTPADDLTDRRETRIDSPIGPLFLVHAGEVLVGVWFRASGAPEGPAPATTRAAFERYFAGELDALDHLPIRMEGTDFEKKVWALLRTIPAGETRSYGDLARQLGGMGLSRAVGRANGHNPISIVVPCHRVIGSDGTLTGYAGGLARKEWLLRHEGWRPEQEMLL